MGDPRNPARADELWDARRLAVMEREIERFAYLGVLSGGWAWHFMSPRPHVELKLLHDHKDVDFFVRPDHFHEFVGLVTGFGYERIWTQYDRVSKDFYRYSKHVEDGDGPPVKVLVDVFLEDAPSVHTANVRVVEPRKLLSYYSIKKHTTDDCVAVQAARALLARGIDPVGRPELVEVRKK